MSRIITEDIKLYQYSELSDEAKSKVVTDYMEDIFNIFEEQLYELGEKILKDSMFSHANLTDIWYDFSYGQGSGAVLSFEYEIENFVLDFSTFKDGILEKFKNELEKYINDYNLTDEEVKEIGYNLTHKELSNIIELNISVAHNHSNYASYDTDFNVTCYETQNIRYCIEDLVEDVIYNDFIKKYEDEINNFERDFSHEAYKWWDSINDIDQYDDMSFYGDWFKEDGTYYEHDEELYN